MKKKELKELAIRMVKCEKIIQDSDDEEKIKKAKNEILKLSKKLKNLEDIFELDIYIQEEMNNNT